MRLCIIFFTIHYILESTNVNGFWIRDLDSEEDEMSLTFESAFERPSFNSRGPRSVYRGLEEGGDFIIVDYSDYQDYDFEYSDYVEKYIH